MAALIPQIPCTVTYDRLHAARSSRYSWWSPPRIDVADT